MSTLMFWNKQNAANQNTETKNGKRNWLHAPDALLNGHVVYLVKFFGNTPVEQAKGIEVVKDAIRRLQFAQQMKKVETGNNPKTKKVEITVSVDGVAIQEPRTQKILHQFPLHNISYCADEKGVKKFFSFIAKNNNSPIQNGGIINNSTTSSTTTTTTATNPTTNGHSASEEGHECFVFISSKLASDITLTIGQAFDLAYRRFVNESGKSTELTKIQAQNKQLERTVSAYKNRLKELTDIIPKSDLDRLLSRLCIRDIFEVPIENGIIENHMNGNKNSESENSNDEKLLIDTSNKGFAPIIPPRNLQNQINNISEAFKGGQKMEELLLNSDSDSDFDPRADEDNGNKISNDLFGFEPPKTFGQQLFTNNNNNINNNNHINNNNNHNNNNNNLTNGFNGNAPPASSPPLLAPPPKAAIPRRSTPNTNGTINNNNGSQDLFGSTPFTNAPTIFDAKIGSDTYKTSSSLNESALNSTFATNNHNNINNNKIVPSLELNNTAAFDEGIRNPFNESGIYDMNDSRLNTILPEINTFTDNHNKLDEVLLSSGSSLSNLESLSSVSSSSQYSATITTTTVMMQNQEKLINPFGGQLSPNSLNNNNDNGGKNIKEKINPFKKAETFLGPRATNYDALRNSPEIEAMQQSSSTSSSSSSSIKKDKISSSSPSFDNIFREAASAAFSELNGGSSGGGTGGNLGSTKHANEFSNKMAGLNFSAHSSSSFGHNDQSNFNPSKPILVDDFSLESLDPLRK